MTGSWLAQAVYTVTKLGIVEALSDGPQAVADRVGAHPDAVYRLLRLLASQGFLSQRGDRRFALTLMGEALRADAPDSLRGRCVRASPPSQR